MISAVFEPKRRFQLIGVTLANCKHAVGHAFHDALKNQTFQAAAALSYYSILCIFPALILLSAVIGSGTASVGSEFRQKGARGWTEARCEAFGSRWTGSHVPERASGFGREH